MSSQARVTSAEALLVLPKKSPDAPPIEVRAIFIPPDNPDADWILDGLRFGNCDLSFSRAEAEALLEFVRCGFEPGWRWRQFMPKPEKAAPEPAEAAP